MIKWVYQWDFRKSRKDYEDKMMFGFKDLEEKRQAIEEIIGLEWNMFQQVQNQGGRAGCQDDYSTFHLMRACQFSVWNDFMLKSYRKDLLDARGAGRNLLTEKYAYMMEVTDPQYFSQVLKDRLPVISAENMNIIDEITWYLMDCEREKAAKYPRLTASGRKTYSGSENGSFASVETYLRGELKTYSGETLRYYLEYVRVNRAQGVNLTLKVLEQMVLAYGYKSLEDAESKM